jgi:hypothetical protein
MRNELNDLRARVARLAGSVVDDQAVERGNAMRAELDVILRAPVRREAELAWTEKYFGDDSPFKINMDGMGQHARAAAIAAAYRADPPGSPDFKPWTPEAPAAMVPA